MDPNYKNFLAWKKSAAGREYLKQKDSQELEKLRYQNAPHFTEHQSKANTNLNTNQLNHISNQNGISNVQNNIERDLWNIDDILNNQEIIENLKSAENEEIEKNEKVTNAGYESKINFNSQTKNNLNIINNNNNNSNDIHNQINITANQDSKCQITSKKLNGVTSVKVNLRTKEENQIENKEEKRELIGSNNNFNKNESHLNFTESKRRTINIPDNQKPNLNYNNGGEVKFNRDPQNFHNNINNKQNNISSNIHNTNSNINYNNSANFNYTFKNNQLNQNQQNFDKRMSLQNPLLENSKQSGNQGGNDSISNNNNYSNSYNSSFNRMYNAIQKNNKNNECSSISINNKKKRNMFFQIVSRDSIAIECDFFLEPALMTIIKEHQGKFDRESRMWNAPYKNYIQIFQKIKECQALGDTNLFPITNLPVEVLCKINYTILKFQIEKVPYEINYTKDRVHTIFELPSNMLTNLYNFQKIGIEFGIKKKGRMLLADEMGVGKTIQAIGISAVYREDWPVLILCPSSLKYAWRDEILNWLKDIVVKKEVQIIKTSKDEFRKEMKFCICSYDLSIRIAEIIEEKNFKFAIADEAHYLKSKESKRSKLMIPILQKCKRLLLLSGTPILAKPVEIYPLLKALRPDIFSSFKSFGSRYCDPKNTPFGIDWSGASNSKELHFILSNLMLRRLKKDVLSELPPKKRQKVEIQTDKKIINQIRVLLNKASKADLENEAVISKLIDDEHNSSNSEKAEDSLNCFTKAYALTGKAKIIGIKDYVNYLLVNKCKFLIFAHHLEVLDSIEDEVKKQEVKYIRIDGSISNEKRHICVNTFQTDENCLVAILAITACATGLTLTKASTVVFSEIHFTPAIMIQAEDRAHRIGQEHTCVNVHYLYGADTVDEILFPKLREKFFVVSTTLDDKRMDMDVQKIKSGCMGDFAGRSKNKNEENSSGLIHLNEKVLNLNNSNSKSGKKTLTLTDYFSVINRKKKEERVDSNYDENKETSITNTDDVIDLNIHEGYVKRDRNIFDDDYGDISILENSLDFGDEEIKDKISRKRLKLEGDKK